MNVNQIERKDSVKSTEIPWYDLLPISVNDTYGDPFIIEQVDNTIAKLQELQNHKAPIAIFTKSPYNEAVIRKLERLKKNPMVIVYYSLTNLNEGGYSFENRLQMIDALRELFLHVVIFTRPIIKNRNDDPATLQKLVDVASSRSKLLVLGGLHDKYKNKKIDFTVEDTLIKMCDRAGVKCFHKTSCCAAYLHGVPCWMHDLGAPINLDVAMKLGYQFELLDDNTIVLNEASTGDLNFLRMLTRANIMARRIHSNYNLLTIRSGTQKYEATSSWFAWSENIDTCLDCDYCIIKQIEYLKKMKVKIGTHPRDMLAVVERNSDGVNFSEFKLTKLKNTAEDFHTYADVRVTKPCFTKRYEPYSTSNPT